MQYSTARVSDVSSVTKTDQLSFSKSNSNNTAAKLSEYRLDRNYGSGFDSLLLVTIAILVMFSVMMLYSTTGLLADNHFNDTLYYVKRQCMAAVLGFILLVVGYLLPHSALKKVSIFALPLAFILLALPLIPGLGDSAGGASRWINLGIVRFQPSELVKLLVVLFMAGFFARHEERIRSFKYGVAIPIICIVSVAALLLLQPDFGSSAVITLVVVAMALACGTPLRYLFFAAGLLIPVAGLLVWSSPYRMQRVVSFMTPWADPSGKGYQLIQSLIAVASGEAFGVGLGASQQKLSFLPAAHTDFLFAVIAEELGFLGCLAVISAFLMILWRGLRAANFQRSDTFLYGLGTGLTLLLVVPALLNMGVVIGLLPTKGMVLPLVGYGGSSLISSLMIVGLLLGLHRKR